MSGFGGVKLHIVTGKGGTGKTTVAAALALALAREGRHVLLTEVEGRQGIAQLFDTAPLPYEERRVATGAGGPGPGGPGPGGPGPGGTASPRPASGSGRGGGEVYALAVDPEAALIEYLEMFYNLRRAGAALHKLGAIDFATTIAPGLRDVLLTGKVMEAATRERRGGGRIYDTVVLDAPPTGRIARFLNVNSEVAGLARMGPVRQQADSVMNLIRSRKTAVHLVTLLEEMPVQETADAVTELRQVNLPVGAVIVNMVREPLLPVELLPQIAADGLDTAALATGLKRAGLEVTDVQLAALAGEAADHADRVLLEQRERALLQGLGAPIVELPLLSGGPDLAGLYELARLLQDAGFG